MASIRKRENRKSPWVVDIFVSGKRVSKSFTTKSEAQAWALQKEVSIKRMEEGELPDIQFKNVLERYLNEVSVHKKGYRWEMFRLNKFMRLPLAQKHVSKIDTPDFVNWRNEFATKVAASTVNREMNLMSHVCSVAFKEWRWLAKNPMENVRTLRKPQPRDRRISDREIEMMKISLGYSEDLMPVTVEQKVAVAFLFALETAMRAGEIVGLSWDDINVERQTAFLRDTKNGTSRKVPLSREAVRLLGKLPKTNPCFGITSQNVNTAFRRARLKTGIENLHFHDSRHEAITRLAKKIPVLDLARMVGHKNIQMLMVYYNETAEDLAKRLD